PTTRSPSKISYSLGSGIYKLSWDNTNKIRKVRVTIHIDGSATYSQDAVYHGVNSSGVHPSGDTTGNDGIGGQAVLYISGTFSSNNHRLCGWDTVHDQAAVTSNVCDFSKWTPNTSMLMVVAHGSTTSISLGGGNACY